MATALEGGRAPTPRIVTHEIEGTPRPLILENGKRLNHLRKTNFRDMEKPLMDLLRSVNPSRSAVVFDIDETILINDPKIDACYHARPNHGIMKLYRLCLRLQIAVYFVTARRLSDDNYEWTTKQLQCIGAGKYAELHMCPESYRVSPAKISDFKKRARDRIARKSGREIVLNTGDQWTDTMQFKSNREVRAFDEKDRKSYWLFAPVEDNAMWQLKLPDRGGY